MRKIFLIAGLLAVSGNLAPSARYLRRFIFLSIVLCGVVFCDKSWSDTPPDFMVGAKILFSTSMPTAYVYTKANVEVDTKAALGFAVLPGEGFPYQEAAYGTRLSPDAPEKNQSAALKVRLPREFVKGYFVIDGEQAKANFNATSIDLSQPKGIKILRSFKNLRFCSDIFTVHIQYKCPNGHAFGFGFGAPCSFNPTISTITTACPLIDLRLVKKIEQDHGPFDGHQVGGIEYFSPQEATLMETKQPYYVCTGWYVGGMWDVWDTYISYNDSIGEDELKSLCVFAYVNNVPVHPCSTDALGCNPLTITPDEYQRLQLLKKDILNHKNIFLYHGEDDD